MQIMEISKKKFSPASESERAKCKALMEKKRKEGDKMVKGMFEFVDAQGGWIHFSYRFWPGESLKTVKITHGEVIDIPMELAKHLNNVYKKVHLNQVEFGKPRTVQKTSRTRFTPMDMLSDDILKAV